MGTGKEISIRGLAEMIATISGFSGDLIFDQSMPDGTPRKVLDVSQINKEGWKHKIDLEYGLGLTYSSFVEQKSNKELLRLNDA